MEQVGTFFHTYIFVLTSKLESFTIPSMVMTDWFVILPGTGYLSFIAIKLLNS